MSSGTILHVDKVMWEGTILHVDKVMWEQKLTTSILVLAVSFAVMDNFCAVYALRLSRSCPCLLPLIDAITGYRGLQLSTCTQ